MRLCFSLHLWDGSTSSFASVWAELNRLDLIFKAHPSLKIPWRVSERQPPLQLCSNTHSLGVLRVCFSDPYPAFHGVFVHVKLCHRMQVDTITIWTEKWTRIWKKYLIWSYFVPEWLWNVLCCRECQRRLHVFSLCWWVARPWALILITIR